MDFWDSGLAFRGYVVELRAASQLNLPGLFYGLCGLQVGSSKFGVARGGATAKKPEKRQARATKYEAQANCSGN